MRTFDIRVDPSTYDYMDGHCPETIKVEAETSEEALKKAMENPPDFVKDLEEEPGFSLLACKDLLEEQTERCLLEASKTGLPRFEAIDLLNPSFNKDYQYLVKFYKNRYVLANIHRSYHNDGWDIVHHYASRFIPPDQPGCNVVAIWRLVTQDGDSVT